jgi:hypothetical protein
MVKIFNISYEHDMLYIYHNGMSFDTYFVPSSKKKGIKIFQSLKNRENIKFFAESNNVLEYEYDDEDNYHFDCFSGHINSIEFENDKLTISNFDQNSYIFNITINFDEIPEKYIINAFNNVIKDIKNNM